MGIIQRIRAAIRPKRSDQLALPSDFREGQGYEIRFSESTLARSFEAAMPSQIAADYSRYDPEFDNEIAADIEMLRAQARDLKKNNDFARKAAWKLKEGIVYEGIWPKFRFKKPSGEINKDLNEEMKRSFKRWARLGTCEVTGTMSWVDVLNSAIDSLIFDGDFFAVKIYEKTTRNPWGFSLQVLEASDIDETLAGDLPNGRRVVMGVEKDQYGRPIAYYRKANTADPGMTQIRGKAYIRIPAERMIHVFLRESSRQTRGVPWIRSPHLRNLGMYVGATLGTAIHAAASMLFYVRQPQAPNPLQQGATDATGKQKGDPTQGMKKGPDGKFLRSLSPGSAEIVPQGWDVKSVKFDQPSEQFDPFVKSQLRGFAGGVGVNYNSIAQDMEGVSYSSLRHATLEERDHFKVVQRLLIDHLCQEVYRDWLKVSSLQKAIPIPIATVDQYDEIDWVTRSFPWVDPLKDAEAFEKWMKMGTETKSRILGERGIGYEEFLEEVAYERSLEDKYGIKFSDRLDEMKAEGQAKVKKNDVKAPTSNDDEIS